MTSELQRADAPEQTMTLEQVAIVGDLSKLTPGDRVMYYREVCKSLSLNPLTKPFSYIVLNGKLTLYATRTATDQLRALRSISIDRVEQEEAGDLYTVTVYAHDMTGRTDVDEGVVSVAKLTGENRANAIMKAITKGKRRVTLSICGLGWLDELEVASIASAEAVDVDMETGEVRRQVPLREQVAARRAAIQSGPAPFVPRKDGTVDELRPTLPARPGQEGVRDDPSGEPPPPVDHAAALDVTPDRQAPGNTDEGLATPIPDGSAMTMAASDLCGAPSPYGDDLVCYLMSGHRNAHRSAEATWT